ncbi:MAG: cytochrome P450 [Chloroflexi bacterium]|nr:cytochrome P450 [Chloroflexota bacterium]
MSEATGEPVTSTLFYNPLDPKVHANPYPMFRRMREEDPVHWSDLMEAWILTRYDDVVSVLTDSRFSANRREARNRFAQEAMRIEEEFGPFGRTQTMLTSDPPEHTRLRKLVSKAFTARTVENLRPRIQKIVDELLDALRGDGRFDVIQDLAYPLPVIVIAEMLGVPPEERARFKQWSNEIVATLGGAFAPPEVLERGRQSVLELAGYFQGVIAERRREPKDDLVSGLIAAEEQGQVLSEDEMLATAMLLLVAGNETTTNLIGNGMLALLRNPDQLERLRDDPSLIQSAVEELLRYDGPVQGTGRVAREDLEIDGRHVEAGQVVFTLLGAADHDPARFENPDELDIGRKDNPHVAFGDGIHFCLGAALARAEAQTAIGTLLQRFPDPRLAGDEVQWGGTFIIRGLKALPISF